jgi:hypothetical protein
MSPFYVVPANTPARAKPYGELAKALVAAGMAPYVAYVVRRAGDSWVLVACSDADQLYRHACHHCGREHHDGHDERTGKCFFSPTHFMSLPYRNPHLTDLP